MALSKLLQKIMDFLGSIFAQKKVAEVGFGAAVELISKELAAEENALCESASMKFSEVKHLVSNLSKNAAALESQKIDLQEGNKAYRQIVATSQKNLARQLKGLSQKLLPPSVATPASISEYAPRALESISGLMPYWKNIALARLILKEEVKEIGVNLKELEGILRELHEKSSSGKIAELRSLKAIAEKISSFESEKSAMEKAVAGAEKSVSASQQAFSSLQVSLASKQGSPEAKELAAVGEKKALLETRKKEIVSRMNSELAPLEKVLKRLSSLSDSALSPRESEVLGLLLEKPEGAIISDPKGEVAKSLLSKAKAMVESGSISLKDSEKEKRLEALASLALKDFFSEYFWEMNKCQSELGQLERQVSSLSVSSEIKALEASVKGAESELVSARASLAELQGRLHDTAEKENSACSKFASEFNSAFAGKRALAEN
ncbi:Uncharacterised protein [uncultured archaeon]|nr:Uncharacterised protein [uncultured archaeon]